MAQFEAVIFDLDGLVLDTEPTYRIAWERAAEDLGFELDDAFFATLSGAQGSEVEAALLARMGSDFALAEFRQRSGAHWRQHVDEHGIATKPGAEALLQHLGEQGLPYALATNSPRQAAQFCLQLAGLGDAFSLIVARDDVARGKPAPDVFLEAAQRLGAEPCTCLALEDSLPGLSAAHQAGTAPVLVTQCQATARAGTGMALRVLPSLEHVLAEFFH